MEELRRARGAQRIISTYERLFGFQRRTRLQRHTPHAIDDEVEALRQDRLILQTKFPRRPCER